MRNKSLNALLDKNYILILPNVSHKNLIYNAVKRPTLLRPHLLLVSVLMVSFSPCLLFTS